jgi:CheY-like chemotaxis protein
MNIQGMSGLDVSRSIQSMAWVDMPAVFLMTEDPEGMRDHAGRAGILDVLQKPFFVSSLRNVIETKDICFTGGSTMTADEKDNPLTGLRFLAAEDNMINADILKELLEMEGARCEIAGNGLAALAMFRSSKPGYYDMLLMDVSMPIMDGYEATRQIRKLDREDAATIPILAMTANTFAEDMDKSFAAGMNAHITKPLDIRLLNATVKRLRAGNTDHK